MDAPAHMPHSQTFLSRLPTPAPGPALSGPKRRKLQAADDILGRVRKGEVSGRPASPRDACAGSPYCSSWDAPGAAE